MSEKKFLEDGCCRAGWLKRPKINVSTRDWIQQKFGNRAMEIVKEWIEL